MRKYAFSVMLALTGTLALGACTQQNEGAQPAQGPAEAAQSGSAADCDQLVNKLASVQPANSASVTAPTLKTDPGAAKAGSAGSDMDADVDDQDQGPQLSAADREAQTACYSYLQGLVRDNLKGMTARQPYAYLVPAGNDDAAVAQRQRQLGNVGDVVARGVTPGNLVAVAGPDSTKTADVLVAAFKNAQSKSLDGVIVVFVGKTADQQRVKNAVAPSGAEFRFVAM